MKISWLFIITLLVLVAIFSVQNAAPITVHFLSWEFAMSAALVIQLAALFGGLIGLICGAWSRRASRRPTPPPPAPTPVADEELHPAPAPDDQIQRLS